MILLIGAILGFVSVAFGAFANHGLRENITSEDFSFLMTAVRYNQVHAIAIITIGLSQLTKGALSKNRLLRWSGLLFITGTILFSFSIYGSISLSLPGLGNVAPVGGIIMMAAWLLLAVSAVVAIRRRSQR